MFPAESVAPPWESVYHMTAGVGEDTKTVGRWRYSASSGPRIYGYGNNTRTFPFRFILTAVLLG